MDLCWGGTDLNFHLVADQDLRHEQQSVVVLVVRCKTGGNAEADRRWFHNLLALMSRSSPPSPFLPVGVSTAEPIGRNMVVAIVAVACVVGRL